MNAKTGTRKNFYVLAVGLIRADTIALYLELFLLEFLYLRPGRN